MPGDGAGVRPSSPGCTGEGPWGVGLVGTTKGALSPWKPLPTMAASRANGGSEDEIVQATKEEKVLSPGHPYYVQAPLF